MSEPLVCCVMLVNGRPEMVRRAVASFRAQAYERKWLLIANNGPDITDTSLAADNIWIFTMRRKHEPRTIGAYRNEANGFSAIAEMPIETGSIIAHWDSDDWSHPNRLAEQVALLQAGEPAGVECVGYNEAVFWDERLTTMRAYAPIGSAEAQDFDTHKAWIYRYANPTYALGTSLMYWRRAWERKPFDDINHGEDERFRLAHRTVGVSSLGESGSMVKMADVSVHGGPKMYTPILGTEPRLIVSIHAGNTSKFDPAANRATCKRVPEFDEYCREAMRL